MWDTSFLKVNLDHHASANMSINDSSNNAIWSNGSLNHLMLPAKTPLPEVLDDNSSNPVKCGFPGQFNTSFGDSFYETYVLYRFVLDVFLGGTFCLFGLIGNTLSFIVLGRIPGKSTLILLRALSIADIIYLITCLFFQVMKTIHFYTPSFLNAFPQFAYVEVIIWPSAAMAQTCSVWLVVLVTADRCLGISRPLHAKSIATVQRALLSIVAVATFAVVFNIPTAFDLTLKIIVDPCTNETRKDAAASDLSKNPVYQLAYKAILCFVFRTAIPLVLVIAFNVQIVQAILQSRQQSLNAVRTNEPTHKSNLNKVIAGVVLIFVICESPDFTFRLLRAVSFYNPQILDWNKMMYFAHFSNLMLTVNSSANFIAYCVVGKKFRQILKEMSCPCTNRKRLNMPSHGQRQSLCTTKTTLLTPLTPVGDRLIKLKIKDSP